MEENIKKHAQTPTKTEVKELVSPDFPIIDEYFANGYNATQAVLKFKDISYNAARADGSRMLQRAENRDYIAKKRYELSIEANVTINDLVRELKGFAFADITKYIGLTEAEVKQLPHVDRRQIKKIVTTNKTFTDREGGTTNEIKTIYEIHDKIKAIDMLGKHLGIYELHNQQQQKTIDLTNATPEQLNAVLSLLEQQKKVSEGNQ